MTKEDVAVCSSVNLELQAHIDEACDRFEIQWKASIDGADPRPEIEEFLVGWQEPALSSLLRELVVIDAAYRQKSASCLSSEEYEQRFPNHATVVRSAFAASTATWSNQQQEAASWIGKYRVIDLLGRGGQASTFLVFDPDLQRRVVIKQYHSTGTAIEREAVLNEGRALARVRSPYVAQCLNVERVDDDIYLVVEYVRGKNLAETIRELPLTFRNAAKMVAQIAEGLRDVHVCGLLHRDIKPANVIVCDDGICRLVDFGLAVPLTVESLEQLGGTLQFMSPEQANSETDRIDLRSDVFGLGAVLYQLLTGIPPYDGSSRTEIWRKACAGQFQPPRSVRPEIPERLERICLKAMALDPAKRFKSADAFGRALRRYLRAAHEDQATPRAHDVELEIPGSPYKGLEAYTEADAHLFFGRDEQIERLWSSLRDLHSDQAIESNTPRVLPVVGPSGSGKSSLVRAGLIAELQRRSLPGREPPPCVIIKPGQRPLEALATALAREITGDPMPATKSREFEEQFRLEGSRGEYDGLRRIVDLIPGRSRQLLIVVDQLEELYSLCTDANERQTFVDLLCTAASDRAAIVSVVLTLRSDFLGQTQDHPLLNSLVSERGLLVPAMTETELRAAIGEPAVQAGRPLDSAVVDLLTTDTKWRQGALPLLQFALTRIWEGLREGHHPAETLRAIGGVGGALAGEAQRIYDGLNTQDRQIARRAFLAMIQLGEDDRATRRRAGLKDIASVADDPKHVHAVMSRFASPGCRLVTLLATGEQQDAVEITHEALLENWPTLKEWIAQSRDDLRFLRRLDEAAQHWLDEGRVEGLVWRSPDLDSLRHFYQRNGDELSATQVDFFTASDRFDQATKRKERQRLRLYQALAAVISVLAFAALFFGVKERQARQTGDQLAKVAMNGFMILSRGAQDELKAVPGAEARSVRKKMIRTTISGLETISEALQDGTDKTILLATTHRHQGDIFMEEGQYEEALREYTKCRSALLPTIDAPKYRVQPWLPLFNLARAEDGIGEAQTHLKNYSDAREHLEQAYRYRQQCDELLRQERVTSSNGSGLRPQDLRKEMEASADGLGRLYREEGRFALALKWYQELLALRRAGAAEAPESADRQRDLAGALWSVGAMHRMLGNYESATEHIEQACAALKQLEAKGHQELSVVANRALFQTELGQAYEYSAESAAAAAQYEEAVATLRQVYQSNRGLYALRLMFWRSLYRLATVNRDSEPEAAQALFEEALELTSELQNDRVYGLWSLARCNRLEDAEALADGLAMQHSDKQKDLYEVACGYALCAYSLMATAGPDLSDAERQRFDLFAEKAMAALKKAIANGYSSAAEINNNPDLAAIRDLPEFASVLKTLAASGDNHQIVD